jgi:hypothetical protein
MPADHPREPRCPGCGYDLSGLGLSERTGDCPECGRRLPVGTEIAAVRERMRIADGARKCPVCRGDLTGHSGDRCPGCGSRYSLRD